jgi:hypothetical protein
VASDHAEQLTQARRLLTRGTVVLGGPGESIPELPYWPVRTDHESRSRLYPGTAVAYLPFVAADAALGLALPTDFGPLAAAAGHAWVLLALALLARVALLRGGTVGFRHPAKPGAGPMGATSQTDAPPPPSPRRFRRRGEPGAGPMGATSQTELLRPQTPVAGVAAAIALVGTAWPVWQVARHAGSEPVLGAAFAAGLFAHERRNKLGLALACAALPWVHPTGVVLAAALACASLVEGSADRWFAPRNALPALVVSFAALLAWNAASHGQALAGGYGGAAGGRQYLGRDPVGAAVYYLTESIRLAPIVLLPLVACGVGARRRALALPALLLVLHVGLFAVLSQPTGQEPGRRLAVVWLAALPALAFGWERLRPGLVAALLLLVAALAWGMLGFWASEAHYFPAGDGTYLPLVWWLAAARTGTPLAAIAVPLGMLVAVAGVAGLRTLRLAASSGPDPSPVGPVPRT